MRAIMLLRRSLALTITFVPLACSPATSVTESVGDSGTSTGNAETTSTSTSNAETSTSAAVESSSSETTESSSGGDESTTTTSGGDSTAADTSGESISGETGEPHHVVECERAGTMTWHGDVYIFQAEDMTLLEGYAMITGNLAISSEEIDNLDFLACLTEVGGNIQ